MNEPHAVNGDFTDELADEALDRAGGGDGVCISCDRSAHEYPPHPVKAANPRF